MAISFSSVPTLIADRYRVEGELGRGGMAEVRAGTDLRLERPVAIKFLLPEMAARDDIRRRFEAEARTAASFSHPNAVAVYDTGEHEGTPYIVMERLPGETLADRIDAGPVDPIWLREVACEVLGALAVAHAAGLVHRDVKPGNILITADNHAKIADFGIAKSLETAGNLDLTGTGQLLGTPAYLAPERLDGAPATARSDLYALGVVLYEALAGANPFPGDTPLATARAVAAGEFRPLREARLGLDPALATTVEQAMARDPDRRFGSADAMATALSSRAAPAAGAPTLVDTPRGPKTVVLQRLPAGGPVTEPGEPVGETAVFAEPTVRPGVPAPMARPRFRVPLALLAALVFIALLVAGLNRNKPATSTGPTAAQAETSASSTPSTTAAPSPTAALANDLRAFAGRLGPADGARAGDLATLLRTVADQVQAGGGGGAATGATISVGAWRLTGQLTDAAATTANTLLARVPGVTAIAPLAPAVTAAPAAPPANNNPGPTKGKGKGKDG